MLLDIKISKMHTFRQCKKKKKTDKYTKKESRHVPTKASIYDKDDIALQWQYDSLFNMDQGKLDIHMRK